MQIFKLVSLRVFLSYDIFFQRIFLFFFFIFFFFCERVTPQTTFTKILRLSLHQFSLSLFLTHIHSLSLALVNPRRKLETLVRENNKKADIKNLRFVRVDRGGSPDPPQPTQRTFQHRRSRSISSSNTISILFLSFFKREKKKFQSLEKINFHPIPSNSHVLRTKFRIPSLKIRRRRWKRGARIDRSRACHVERNGPRGAL